MLGENVDDALAREFKHAWTVRIAKRKQLMQEKKARLIDIARRCAAILRDEFSIEAIFLTGSLALALPINERTDIDIAVRGLPARLYFHALNALYAVLPHDVELDLITLESATPEMAAFIEAHGMRL